MRQPQPTLRYSISEWARRANEPSYSRRHKGGADPRAKSAGGFTPLLYGGLLYCISDNGVLKTYDAMTGKLTYIKRVGAGVGFSASPIVVDSRIFFSSEDGEVYVVKAGTEFDILAKNVMGETVLASPAFSDDVLYFRTRGRVVAIGAPVR